MTTELDEVSRGASWSSLTNPQASARRPSSSRRFRVSVRGLVGRPTELSRKSIVAYDFGHQKRFQSEERCFVIVDQRLSRGAETCHALSALICFPSRSFNF